MQFYTVVNKKYLKSNYPKKPKRNNCSRLENYRKCFKKSSSALRGNFFCIWFNCCQATFLLSLCKIKSFNNYFVVLSSCITLLHLVAHENIYYVTFSLPKKTPIAKTIAPPTITCISVLAKGVFIYR